MGNILRIMEKILNSPQILTIVLTGIWFIGLMIQHKTFFIKRKSIRIITQIFLYTLIFINMPIIPQGFIVQAITERNRNVPNIDSIWYENVKPYNLVISQDDDKEYHYHISTKYGTLSGKDIDVPDDMNIQFINGESYVKYKFHKYTDKDWARLDKVITTFDVDVINISNSYPIKIFND